MNKEVVNVRSQEEWDYVTEKSGIKWSNGACWQHIGEECCINISDKKYWSIDVYQNENFSILSFEEFKSRYEPSAKVVNEKFKNEMKEVNLTIEQAKQFIPKDKWKEFGIEEEIVLRDWKELEFEGSYYPNHNGKIYNRDCKSDTNSLNVPTQKHAKSMLAFSKLSMLMADLGDECNVDWENEHQTKFTIIASKNKLFHDYEYTKKTFLSFKTYKIRDAFFNKHQQLIKDYFML